MGTVTRRRVKPRGLLEWQIQRNICELLSLYCVKFRFLYFSIPNEGVGVKGKPGTPSLQKLLDMGMLPGAADLCIVHDGKAYFIEVKRPGEKQSDKQKVFAGNCRLVGSEYAVVHSAKGAYGWLRKWGVIS